MFVHPLHVKILGVEFSWITEQFRVLLRSGLSLAGTGMVIFTLVCDRLIELALQFKVVPALLRVCPSGGGSLIALHFGILARGTSGV